MIAILSASFQVEGYFDDLREQLIISVRGCRITLSESFKNRKLINFVWSWGFVGRSFQDYSSYLIGRNISQLEHFLRG